MTESEAHAAGYAAFEEFRACRCYAGLADPLTVRPEDAEKSFLPPVDEGDTPMQMVRPWPKDRLAWRAGFALAQANARAGHGASHE